MRKIIAAIILPTLAACAGTNTLTLKPAQPKPIDCALELYTAENEIPHKFETLCVVEAQTGTGMLDNRTATAAINLARPELCKCGADAGLIVDSHSRTASWWLPSSTDQMRGQAQIKGVRFLAEQESQVAPK